jgi:CrcB protein
MRDALLIFVGGGLGSLCRWGLSAGVTTLAERTALNRFPAGILACNLLGCLAIGCAFGWFAPRWHPPWLFPLLVTGFLGGFTTFSTFGRDTHQLLANGLSLAALANVLLSVAGGLICVWAGIKLAS